jgi:hypothetical protein
LPPELNAQAAPEKLVRSNHIEGNSMSASLGADAPV